MKDDSTATAVETKSGPPSSWRDRALADSRDFVEELKELREKDRGRMAELRRNAGEKLPGRGTSWFYRYLYRLERQRYAEIHFLVATLFDLNRKDSDHGDFGQTLQALALKMHSNDKPEEAKRRFRRFHILVDSEFDSIYDPLNSKVPWQKGGGELAFRLRQMIKLLASKEIGVTWAELLVDLCDWSHPDKRVQKKWARSFFGTGSPVQARSFNDVEMSSEPETD